MNVFALQLDIAWHDKPANHRKVSALLDRARVPAGSLAVLPEMFASGFSMDVAAITDDASRETEQFLLDIAKNRNIAIIGGLVTRGPDGRGRNEAIVAFPDGREPIRYQKIHTFTPGGESEHYTCGSDIVLFEWQGFTIAPFICYDLRFPELFREAVMKGAQVMVVIANWPAVREDHWLTLLKARAIENLSYVIGVNCCGKDPKTTYTGRTQILGPRGGEIAGAGVGEEVISARLSLPALQAWRDEFPALTDIKQESIIL